MALKAINIYYAPFKTCNLNCLHCYLPSSSRQVEKTDEQAALNSLRELIQKCENEGFRFGSFCLHGAEPSLFSPEKLAEAVALVTEHWKKNNCTKLAVAMQSNGIRLTQEYLTVVAEKLNSKKMFRPGFSIDPPKQVHDNYRNATFDTVEKNYLNAMELGYLCSVLAVVHSDTMNHLEAFADWCERELARKHSEGNPYRIKIKLATGKTALSEAEVERFGYFLFERNLLNLVQILTPGYCLIGGNECEWYEFSADGGCYSCNKNLNEEGRFADWRKESFTEIFRRRSKLFADEPVHNDCGLCEYEFLCNSGCPADRHKDGLLCGKAHECSLIKIAYSEVSKKGIPIGKFFNENK